MTSLNRSLLKVIQALPCWDPLHLIRCRKAWMPVLVFTPSRPTRINRPTPRRSSMSNHTRLSLQLRAKRARRKKDKVSTLPTASLTSREWIASRTRAWIRNLLPLSNSFRTSLISVPKWVLGLSLQIDNRWMSGTKTTSTKKWLSSITLVIGSASGQLPLLISEMRT